MRRDGAKTAEERKGVARRSSCEVVLPKAEVQVEEYKQVSADGREGVAVPEPYRRRRMTERRKERQKGMRDDEGRV